jgi:hypothetical protein
LKTARQFRSGEDLIQLAIRLGLLAFLIYWTFVLIRPFVPILAWSIVLAVALYPVFNLLSRLLGGRPSSQRQFSPLSISASSSGRRPGLA